MTNRTKALFGLSGVFLLGLLCGALAVGLFVRDRVQERSRLKNEVGFRDFFADELSLTEGQKDSLQAELEQAYRQLADIRSQVDLEYREVFDTLARRLDPMLTARQRRAFAEQKERLLPKRTAGDSLRSSIPTIQEIDRNATAATSSGAEPAASVPSGSDRAKRDSAAGNTAEKNNAGPQLSPDEVIEDDFTAGDSLLTPNMREEHLPRAITYLKRRLSLTDDQTVKVEEFARKALRRNAWIRENFRDEPLARRRRLRQSFRLLDRQVSDLLTGEQLKTYNGMKKWRKGKQ